VIGSGEPAEVAKVTGQEKPTACFGDDRHDMGVDDVFRPRTARLEHGSDEAGKSAVGVPARDRVLPAREERIDLLAPVRPAVQLGEYDRRYHDRAPEPGGRGKRPAYPPVSG